MLSYHVVSVPFSVRQVSGAYQYLRCPRPQCRTAYGCLPVYRRVQCAYLCAGACRKRYSDRLFYRSLRLFYPQISVPAYKETFIIALIHSIFLFPVMPSLLLPAYASDVCGYFRKCCRTNVPYPPRSPSFLRQSIPCRWR